MKYLCAMAGIRINKFIRETGLFSRREADKAIEDGRVSVNKKTAKSGMIVNENDKIRLDGELINPFGAKKKTKTVQQSAINPKSKTIRQQQSESNKAKYEHK